LKFGGLVMGKLKCLCDYILSDTCGDDGEAFSDELETYHPGEGRSILECPKCGTLAIEDPKESCFVKFYKPDNGQFNALFRRRG